VTHDRPDAATDGFTDGQRRLHCRLGRQPPSRATKPKSLVRIQSGACGQVRLVEPDLALGADWQALCVLDAPRSAGVSESHEKSRLRLFRSLHGPFERSPNA
jgi:hypothetical protein